MNWFALALVLGLFITLMVIFSRDDMDYVTYALLFAAISVITVAFLYELDFEDILDFVEFKPLIFIFSMQIMISIAERYRIFQWIAIKTLHITKGNHRRFFYLICTVSTLMAGLIADLTVTIIFIPIVIRACKILNIKPAPYLYGITITINIGSIITAFSSSENIIMSDVFALDNFWYFSNVLVISLIMLFTTLVMMDYTELRKMEPPSERSKTILMEIMSPSVVVEDKKNMTMNAIYFLVVLLALIFVKESYIIALFGALLMSLLERIKITESVKLIDWKLLLFLLAIFLLIGAMDVIGIFAVISGALDPVAGNLILAAIFVFVLSSLMSGLLSNAPTMLAFITIVLNLYGPAPPDIILIALVTGVHLGGNITPQGSACDVMTLNIAEKYHIDDVNYMGLLKKGAAYSFLHLLIGVVFLVFYGLVLM